MAKGRNPPRRSIGGEVLRHFDDRLDRSAQQALSKWELTPAEGSKSPVEVDAVSEIPFLGKRPVR